MPTGNRSASPGLIRKSICVSLALAGVAAGMWLLSDLLSAFGERHTSILLVATGVTLTGGGFAWLWAELTNN
jgi:hypothetical protein